MAPPHTMAYRTSGRTRSDRASTKKAAAVSSKRDSAAAKVFGVFELLENILLSLGDDAAHVVTVDHSKELFTIQRVNRAFHDTIHGSSMLKFKMGLALAPRCLRGTARKADLFSPYLKGKLLGMEPASYRDDRMYTVPQSSLEEDENSMFEEDLEDNEEDDEDEKQWKIEMRDWIARDIVHLGFSLRIDNEDHSMGESAWISGSSGYRHSELHHSWRNLKMTTSGVQAIVAFEVNFRNPYKDDYEQNQWSKYNENMFSYLHDYTLGELVDLVEAISHRSTAEHAIAMFCGDHEMAERVLSKARGMHIAWMQFEPKLALKRLERQADNYNWCTGKPSIERLEIQLQKQETIRLKPGWERRNHYLPNGAEDPTPTSQYWINSSSNWEKDMDKWMEEYKSSNAAGLDTEDSKVASDHRGVTLASMSVGDDDNTEPESDSTPDQETQDHLTPTHSDSELVKGNTATNAVDFQETSMSEDSEEQATVRQPFKDAITLEVSSFERSSSKEPTTNEMEMDETDWVSESPRPSHSQCNPDLNTNANDDVSQPDVQPSEQTFQASSSTDDDDGTDCTFDLAPEDGSETQKPEVQSNAKSPEFNSNIQHLYSTPTSIKQFAGIPINEITIPKRMGPRRITRQAISTPGLGTHALVHRSIDAETGRIIRTSAKKFTTSKIEGVEDDATSRITDASSIQGHAMQKLAVTADQTYEPNSSLIDDRSQTSTSIMEVAAESSESSASNHRTPIVEASMTAKTTNQRTVSMLSGIADVALIGLAVVVVWWVLWMLIDLWSYHYEEHRWKG